jgi:hypothetical protein
MTPESVFKEASHPDYMKLPELKDGQMKDKNGRVLPRYPGWFMYTKYDPDNFTYPQVTLEHMKRYAAKEMELKRT